MKWNAALADITSATALQQQRSKTHDFYDLKYLQLIVQSIRIGGQSTVHPDRKMQICLAETAIGQTSTVQNDDNKYILLKAAKKMENPKWVQMASHLHHSSARWCCQRFDETDIDVDLVHGMNK